MKTGWRIATFFLLILLPRGVDLFAIESVEAGFGCSWHQTGSTYFFDLEPPLLEMSYYLDIGISRTFSVGIAYYSGGQDIGYYYSDDPLVVENWAGPYYRTEAPPDGYDMNLGTAQMHIFDIRFGLKKELSFIDLFAEIGPTVIIPGTLIQSSWEEEDEPFASLPEGWYEVLQQYVAESHGWMPILGANVGVGFKMHLWRVTAWGAARYRYTWGLPTADLLNNFELSFGAGIELYRKKR